MGKAGYPRPMQTFLFNLSKIVRPILVSPFFLTLAIVFIALLVQKAESRVPRLLKRVGLSVIALLSVFSMPIIARGLCGAWETPRGKLEALKEAGPFDAIIVLGGCADPGASNAEHIELNDAAERLAAAVRLYKAGIAPRILVSGGSGFMAPLNEPEAPIMATLLETCGVPTSVIITESASRNTFENATLSKAKLEEVSAKRTVLITSAWHMRRSAAIFKKAGFDFQPYAVDTRRELYGIPGDFLPDAKALSLTTVVVREIVGVIAYRALGRL